MSLPNNFTTIHKDCGGTIEIEQFGDGDCISICTECGEQADEHLDLLDTLFYWGAYQVK